MRNFDDIYLELKAIARRELARHQRSTMNTTGLVHEAFIKLSEHDDALDRAHRINLVAKVMRQITVDHARAKQAQKRGVQANDVEVLDDAEPYDALNGHAKSAIEAFELLAFDQALTQLAQQHPRMARALELSYFAGVEHEEIARLLEVNLRTVQRDLLAARALVQAMLSSNASSS